MRTNRILLPKPVYEVLPFFYLALGSACLIMNHSWALDIMGAYFIARGLFKTILRINYRSPNQALTKSPLRRRGR